jgi:hypothetical protein
MGNNKKSENKSRRGFLSLFLPGNDDTPPTQNVGNGEKVKMLTADGKLVEVDKSIYEAAVKKQKTTNKDIYDWMKNPSKDKK